MNPLTDIEFASYSSWQAFEQIDYFGWIIRFANGYTKRANSVNALTPSNANLPAVIQHCESFYRERRQPTIFRLLSFVDDPSLDSYLADIGYKYLDPSLVLYQKLDSSHNQPLSLIAVEQKLWLHTYCSIAGIDLRTQENHVKILSQVPKQSLFAILEENGQPIACGMGVIFNNYFGIFDIITQQQSRNKGYGARLITNMLSWAWIAGAQDAYVQVVAANAPAVRLYEKLGYRRLYNYWYRIQSSIL
ncbi:GCN5-related N-acetyltransferase [Calothrix sp. NIES-4071]|nr:GCN5-related N-acetyltransferase [Calothrix sp. NIES-4071]BAZ61052.1 GCN5-related N-acetyltransferase [Calothrix sp. NIES-4105]